MWFDAEDPIHLNRSCRDFTRIDQVVRQTHTDEHLEHLEHLALKSLFFMVFSKMLKMLIVSTLSILSDRRAGLLPTQISAFSNSQVTACVSTARRTSVGPVIPVNTSKTDK